MSKCMILAMLLTYTYNQGSRKQPYITCKPCEASTIWSLEPVGNGRPQCLSQLWTCEGLMPRAAGWCAHFAIVRPIGSLGLRPPNSSVLDTQYLQRSGVHGRCCAVRCKPFVINGRGIEMVPYCVLPRCTLNQQPSGR